MTTPVGTFEQSAQPVDFRAQILSAIEHATTYEPNDPLKNESRMNRYADAPDDYVISDLYFPGENQVSTTDPAQYAHLLEQAAQIVTGSSDQTPRAREYLEEAVRHEIAHGEAVRQFGNSATESHYGVVFLIDEDGELNAWPFHVASGPLKKIHHAWKAMAPEDRSDMDIDVATGFGYPNDVELIKQKAFAEPPVEEGWERVVTREDLMEALRALMLDGIDKIEI